MKNLLVLTTLAGLASAQPKLPDIVVMTFADVTPSMSSEFEARGVAIREHIRGAALPID